MDTNTKLTPPVLITWPGWQPPCHKRPACSSNCTWNNRTPKLSNLRISPTLRCHANWYCIPYWQELHNYDTQDKRLKVSFTVSKVDCDDRQRGRRGLYSYQFPVPPLEQFSHPSANVRGPSYGLGSAPAALSPRVLKREDICVLPVWGPTDQSCLSEVSLRAGSLSVLFTRVGAAICKLARPPPKYSHEYHTKWACYSDVCGAGTAQGNQQQRKWILPLRMLSTLLWSCIKTIFLKIIISMLFTCRLGSIFSNVKRNNTLRCSLWKALTWLYSK